ncbi:site-specific integrase [Sphingomonas sp. UMB7805-LC452B]|nr:site-specific integrase [Sphingomonas sp. UMB7805-LC452B]MDK8214635.1 site-specific integrase [Sphingomonas sp. UMB7805-LC452B]
MARTSNLIRRHGRWYFNKAYPKELWPVVGRSPFRLALNTDALEQAQRMRGHAEQRYWAAVDAARKKLGEVVPRALSEVEAVAIVSRWFLQRNADLDHWHLHEPTPPEGWQDAVNGNEVGAADATRRLGTNDIAAYAPLAARVLEAEGIKVDPASSGYRTLLQLLVRANKELSRIDLARLQGDFGYRPSDPVFLSALNAPPTPRRTVGDLIDAYEREKAPSWAPSTKAAHGPAWRLLKDVLGSSRDVATLTRDDGRRLFDTVKALPKGLGKVKSLTGLTVPQAVERAARDGLPVIGPKTVNGSYMAFLSAAFGWAVKEQWLSANPVAGLTAVDAVDAADKRDPFTVDQLRTIFGAAPWSPRDPEPRGKPLHFWGPLLALFHGMRRGEIAQLAVADVTAVDGVTVMLVRPGQDGQRVKTKGSRRMVPVHPELQRMGFLTFVAQQQRAGSHQLFSGEEPNSRGQWGDGFSDWFTRLLVARSVSGKRLGLHSFRHNFEDRLRAAGLRGSDIGKALAGRARQGGSDSGDTYGSGYAATQLAEALALIEYPGLDLSRLHVGTVEAPQRPF